MVFTKKADKITQDNSQVTVKESSMRLTILRNTISVLLIAMTAAGILFFLMISGITRKETTSNMKMTLMVLDGMLDYEKPIEEQIKLLPTTFESKTARYTVFLRNGDVAADSQITNYGILENHASRKEFKEAVEKGYGSANRYSQTLNQQMLYTAVKSTRSDYVLRVAIPYTGPLEYALRLLPAIILSLAAGFFIAFISASRLSFSIIRPVNKIAKTMEEYDETSAELKFERTPYEELNIITAAADSMAQSVKEHTERIEFERMVRQEFFANASHELKTPLTSIRGYMELMLNGYANGEETRQEFMQRVVKETEHMTSLINEILLISQLETNELLVKDQRIRMSVLMDDIKASLEPIAIQQNVSLNIDCKPIAIHADYEYMRQVIQNIVGNGIKYNRPGGSVWVTIWHRGADLILSVKDNGIGIEKEAQARIFERFYRADKSRSRKVGGTGLGLSIVKHIVSFYEGSIEVKSKPGKGTEFIVTFPNLLC